MKNSNVKFYFAKSITDEDGFNQITIPLGAYQIESLNKKRIIVDEEHFTEANYLPTIKLNFSTLGYPVGFSTQGSLISFLPNDHIRDLLDFNASKPYEGSNLSPNPGDLYVLTTFPQKQISLKEKLLEVNEVE